MKSDEYWMQQALLRADKAEAEGEIPVGAIVVYQDEIIAEGWNRSIISHDPSAHAEMLAIRNAGIALQNYRMIDCTLYVTLEPCAMCAGALVHSRMKRVVYGADDLKTGAVKSVMNIVQHSQFNHQLEVTEGVLAQECGLRLSAFFKRRRQEIKALKQANKLKEQE
ncbi:tRNA adenosine(34) deaminase TadA [Pseudoalteromonas tunicata]|jgi:tRNA(adenine34) deaminase|uniref:tRNA-specific adenosine deaminase n=1 Tax=Pseudoalteromonas tunicata D2 TaxID=87626 RepID=A4C7Q4_9GAMM|nr:tRNA adenosine(34) deaminase TadA [Pseudoalteromonas tunicata]ATC95978.1 tRNA(adenine34) deaminase [Pseudoalteromonas tunicata]AXT31512.1 tRNA adenosine(34) deaminase TadA [Pseudoalteromonas tunicata]EAR30008.1 hypothetical protein PTD2_14349 [Pseudoalteromonas tunicata D2]MDP4984528.1 tRNA adenosine(34) deaminase TadA [Pseudoalteromonas tunicata]MDP5215352.1 tRNA adenosine(34) deaminase TadA [Pseudoalteromonas tunicata]